MAGSVRVPRRNYAGSLRRFPVSLVLDIGRHHSPVTNRTLDGVFISRMAVLLEFQCRSKHHGTSVQSGRSCRCQGGYACGPFPLQTLRSYLHWNTRLFFLIRMQSSSGSIEQIRSASSREEAGPNGASVSAYHTIPVNSAPFSQ